MTASIRNFAIVAHIDHGKSTLADRILELTGAVGDREMRSQFLDRMDIERERGITIKAQTVSVVWEGAGGSWHLNLIDTPGHVDFTYEVSRALAACEGIILVVDASQGIEAQTVAHFNTAKEMGLVVLPCVNKCDIEGIDVDEAVIELADWIECDPEEVVRVSAKSGFGLENLLEAVVEKIPPPSVDKEGLRGLVFDSEYDKYRGVVAHVRMVGGHLETGVPLKMMGAKAPFEALEVGTFGAKRIPTKGLDEGQVGYIVTNLKEISLCRVGDTVGHLKAECEALPGYEPAKRMVFASLYPVESDDFAKLRTSIEKLSLNDASLSWEVENNPSFGFGLRMGFLGPLHKEVIQERLEREFDLELISTAPTVAYRITPNNEERRDVARVGDVPQDIAIEKWEEPMVEATISCPDEHLGSVLALVQSRRGEFLGMENPGLRVLAKYRMPMAEIVANFFTALKSATQGYAGLDYRFSGWQETKLQVVEIFVAGDNVEALGMILPVDRVYSTSRILVDKLAEEIPRHQFKVPVQAFSGGRIVAAKTIPPFRKDVTAKCYGGDITRKRKLLKKQKEGKKRMKNVGRVAIPQSALLALLDV
ncbi:elongation factor 4 [bacterium]|nr:elongation factor 4 [bacterium]